MIDEKTFIKLRKEGYPLKRTAFGFKIPSLEELIYECGYGFRSLSLHSDGRWIAKSGKKTGSFLVNDKVSSRKAMIKLWLKLKRGRFL